MQVHAFSDLEGLRIAVEMEKRGMEFYMRASRVAGTPALKALLAALQADERTHMSEFQHLYEDELARKEDAEQVLFDGETNAYLSAFAAEVIFPVGLVGAAQSGALESVDRLLDTAIGSEKDSILFYTELREHTRDAHTAELFSEVIRQERGHLSRLQGMKTGE